MSVTVDSVGTVQTKTAATSFTYSGLTIGAALSNSVAVFAVVTDQNAVGAITISSPAWNSVACTAITSINNAGNNTGVFLFGIVAPASGNKNFTFTTSSSTPLNVYGISFAGANQTGGTTTFAGAQTAQDGGTGFTTKPITITTSTSDYTFAACGVGTGNTTSTLTNTASIAEDWDAASANGTVGAGGHAQVSSGTSITWTAHNSSADFGAIAGCDIVAAAGGATPFGGWFFEPPEITLVTEAIGY